MGALEGRVAIITGAGRGIGRQHALLFAGEGAKVVVNDLGCAVNGSGDDRAAAQRVVDEIKQMGGEAVANTDDVSNWDGGHRLVTAAIEAFGDLHMLVNNAGIIRDRVLVNMTEEEWDLVMHVDVNGHFVPTRWAAAYWREQSKAGPQDHSGCREHLVDFRIVGQPRAVELRDRQSGIAAFTVIAAQELSRYGVRVNAIVPAARTRITESTPGLSDIVQPPATQGCSTPGTPPTCRPSPPISPAISAPLQGRSSSSKEAGCSTSSRGPSRQRSTRANAGRLTNWLSRCREIVGHVSSPAGPPATR